MARLAVSLLGNQGLSSRLLLPCVPHWELPWLTAHGSRPSTLPQKLIMHAT